jgi:hypothetical protein
VDAGCKYIQVDEPLFARKVNDALSFGFEGIDSCFHKVPKVCSAHCSYVLWGTPDHLGMIYIIKKRTLKATVTSVSMIDELNLIKYQSKISTAASTLIFSKSSRRKVLFLAVLQLRPVRWRL